MTDLTVEELDELEQTVRACCSCCRPIDEDKELDIIAMARDKVRVVSLYLDGMDLLRDVVVAKRTVERERDALRALLKEATVPQAMLRAIYDWGGPVSAHICRACERTVWTPRDGDLPHESNCLWVRAQAALAQPTDTGGA